MSWQLGVEMHRILPGHDIALVFVEGRVVCNQGALDRIIFNK